MIEIKKSILIYVLAAAGGLLACLLIFWGMLYFFVPEKALKESAAVFFKDNFNRAVKYDDISFNSFGNIIIKRLSVSVSSDFNDNQHILRAEKAIIEVSLFRFLKGSLSIRKMLFENAEIVINKKLGKTYAEFLDETLADVKPLGDLQHADPGEFMVELSDAAVLYSEGVRDKKLAVEFADVDAKLRFSDGEVRYTAHGKVAPGKTRDISRGKISVQGNIFLDEKKNITGTKNSIDLDNVDLSYLNIHAAEEWESSLAFYGGLSAELLVSTHGSEAGVNGGVRFNNLHITQGESENVYSIVSNENLNIDVTADILDNLGKIVFRELKVYDDNLRITVTGALAFNGSERCLDLMFNTNAIRLSELSMVFSPLRDLSYSGTFAAQGKVFFDLTGKARSALNLTCKADAISLWRGTSRARSYILKNVDALLTCGDDSLEFNSLADKGGSDLACSVKGSVASWLPFSSRMDIGIKGKSAYAGDAWYLFTWISENAVKSAFEDKIRGFEEILFRKRPAGIFANGNTIFFECEIDKIVMGNEAALKGLEAKLRLENGIVKLDSFALSGYGAKYSLEVQSYLNSDYANFRLKGGAEKLDLGRLYADLKGPGSARGECSIRVDYEASGYRIAHLLESGKGDITIQVDNARFKGTALQQRLSGFFSAAGYPEINPQELKVESATITFAQKNESFFLRNLSLQGDPFNFRCFGPYSYYYGFQIPISIMYAVQNEDRALPPKTTHVPAFLKGRVLSPAIAIQKGNEFAELPLLDVD